jgi:hypothetical protein
MANAKVKTEMHGDTSRWCTRIEAKSAARKRRRRADYWATFQPPPLPEAAAHEAARRRLVAMTPREIFMASVASGIHNLDGTLTKRYGGK